VEILFFDFPLIKTEPHNLKNIEPQRAQRNTEKKEVYFVVKKLFPQHHPIFYM